MYTYKHTHAHICLSPCMKAFTKSTVRTFWSDGFRKDFLRLTRSAFWFQLLFISARFLRLWIVALINDLKNDLRFFGSCVLIFINSLAGITSRSNCGNASFSWKDNGFVWNSVNIHIIRFTISCVNTCRYDPVRIIKLITNIHAAQSFVKTFLQSGDQMR